MCIRSDGGIHPPNQRGSDGASRWCRDKYLAPMGFGGGV